MKTNKKCEICSKRFEAARSDAKYCSGACKQKSYALSKSKAKQEIGQKMIFDLKEYQAICDDFGYDSEIFPLIFFCFLRKNLSPDANIPTVKHYINAIWNCNNFEELTASKAYKDFKETFLHDGIKVIST